MIFEGTLIDDLHLAHQYFVDAAMMLGNLRLHLADTLADAPTRNNRQPCFFAERGAYPASLAAVAAAPYWTKARQKRSCL